MPSAGQPLAEILARHTREGELYERLENERVRCFACGHRCLIPPGRDGICRVRFNDKGTLRVPFGYVAALQLDPVEKKPFFHALPGAKALSFGMLGCDYHCAYCQNWVTSQALRDPAAIAPTDAMTPGEIVGAARRAGARIVTSTYNEPLITSEWAVEVFKLAKAQGLVCSYVSNGNGTAEVLEYLRPWVSLYKVDLKAFRDRGYRDLGGTLESVLFTIRALHAKGFWVEVVTLVVPGLNDSARGAARHRSLPGLGLTRHSVARDGVPSRLQDGRQARDVGPVPAARRRDGCRRRAALRLRRQPAGSRAELGEHLLPGLSGVAHRAAGLPGAAQPAGRERALSRLSARRAGSVGLTPDLGARVPESPFVVAVLHLRVELLGGRVDRRLVGWLAQHRVDVREGRARGRAE